MNQQSENILSLSRGAPGLWAEAFADLRKNKLAVLCLIVITVYFALAVFLFIGEKANWNLPLLKWDQTVGPEYERPNLKNILGTDYLGRSVLRKTLYAAKVSVTVSFFAAVISIAIGVILGALAGFFSGIIDDIVTWLYTTFSSIPYILLIVAFALVLKDKSINLKWLSLGNISLAGIPAVCLAIGLTSWAGICRLIRAEVIRQKQFEYVLAAKAKGCSGMRILLRHIMPNIFHIIIVIFTLRFVYFIHAEVMLSFLGLGAKNVPSWGTMIDFARLDLTKGCWWEMTAATAAIFIISLALNIFGDNLRQALDPKLRI